MLKIIQNIVYIFIELGIFHCSHPQVNKVPPESSFGVITTHCCTLVSPYASTNNFIQSCLDLINVNCALQ